MDELTKILQGSIAPTVLISGVGLLLLTMTNRLAKPIDRIRQLCDEIKHKRIENLPETYKQIDIFYLRCQHLRTAITFATISITCVSLIILSLFAMFVFQWNLVYFVQIIFSAAILTLILSLIFFLKDVVLSLHSIKIEIDLTKDRYQK